MLRVLKKPEPTDFNLKVRTPGNDWLVSNGYSGLLKLPKGVKPPPFWTVLSQEFYDTYGGICAYYCFKFYYASGASSIDHFLTKSDNVQAIYDWDNYRLASKGANSKKHIKSIIPDPFTVQDDWFFLEFNTMIIYPNPNLNGNIRDNLLLVIGKNGLDLNSSNLVNMRYDAWKRYAQESYPLNYIKEDFPFIYKEALRQGFI